MLSVACIMRMEENRKTWRKDHPFGFVARPAKNLAGKPYHNIWICYVPGEKATPWDGGIFRLLMTFSNDYPVVPPKCKFIPPLFHPNVLSSGVVCLSLLDKDKDWCESTSLKQILLAIQNILHNPNIEDAVNPEASAIYWQSPLMFYQRIRIQALECSLELSSTFAAHNYLYETATQFLSDVENTDTDTDEENEEAEVAEENKLLMVYKYTVPASIIGIKLYPNKPKFSDATEEAEWKKKALEEAKLLKMEIETGLKDINSLKDRIILNPRMPLSKAEVNRHKTELLTYQENVTTEGKFYLMASKLKTSLTQSKANVGSALLLLKRGGQLKFNKLMILRESESVDVIRKLRRYVGNLDKWNLDEDEKNNFIAHAAVIRGLAAQIVYSFRELFSEVNTKVFWEKYNNEVQIYKKYTTHLSLIDQFSLTDENYEMLIETKKKQEELENPNVSGEKSPEQQ